MSDQRKVLTIVMDGWGLYKRYEGNAIALAKTPTFDKLFETAPRAIFEASGESVGLPDGQMGTSEVNHFTIGAGRTIFQDLVRINRSIRDGNFYKNEQFLKAFAHVKKNGSVLHIMGLVSDGGVHSHQEHIYALLKAAKQQEIQKVLLHVFTDGRDVLPRSAVHYVQQLQRFIQELGVGEIASVAGRYFAMDRDHNWDRTDKSFTVLTQNQLEKKQSAEEGIQASYEAGVFDEFIEPFAVATSFGPAVVTQNDAVIFANFRNDRPRQLTERFLAQGPKNVCFVTMTTFNPDYDVHVAFPPEEQPICMGEIISQAGLKQLRITETEKFAHMTFFLNCKREAAFEGEDRFMFDSYSDIKTHDERPAMRTPDIAQHIIKDIEMGVHNAIFTNLCNADMIGHTGNIEAAIKGAEAVDAALRQILPVATKHGYDVIVTADHGNSDEMIDVETGNILTSHSLNPVPFLIVSPHVKKLRYGVGTLTDVAPTVLTLLGLDVPSEMTGRSLVI